MATAPWNDGSSQWSGEEWSSIDARCCREDIFETLTGKLLQRGLKVPEAVSSRYAYNEVHKT